MQFSYSVRAGENLVFAPGCFDESIGKKKPFTYQVGNKPMREVESTVEKVEISDDGKEVIMTVSIPEEAFKELFGSTRPSHYLFSSIEE